jgi:hypothetical protein
MTFLSGAVVQVDIWDFHLLDSSPLGTWLFASSALSLVSICFSRHFTNDGPIVQHSRDLFCCHLCSLLCSGEFFNLIIIIVQRIQHTTAPHHNPQDCADATQQAGMGTKQWVSQKPVKSSEWMGIVGQQRITPLGFLTGFFVYVYLYCLLRRKYGYIW